MNANVLSDTYIGPADSSSCAGLRKQNNNHVRQLFLGMISLKNKGYYRFKSIRAYKECSNALESIMHTIIHYSFLDR